MRFLHGSYGNNALVCEVVASECFGMDLYFSPLSGSFTVHVACLEARIAPTLHRVDRKTKLLPDGRAYSAVAPQAIVPAIGLPDGSVLTETTAILQYLADRAPATQLAPAWGTPERYRLIEWLAFVSTELHKKHLWPVFSSKTPDPVKEFGRASAKPALDHVARHLESREVLVGDHFTVADIYLVWALFVAPHGGISLNPHPALKAYVERHRARPSFATAFAVEVPLYTQEAAAGAAPVSRLAAS
jgi:glutathione S-transferase